MKRCVSFCKSYFIEILFALAVIFFVIFTNSELVLDFVYFIVLTAIFIMLLCYLLTSVGIEGDKIDNDEAVRCFYEKYGCNPQDKGFYAISSQEQYCFYIYAISKDVIVAYMQQHKIINWIVKWYLKSWIIILALFITVFIVRHNVFHPSCVFICIFSGFWLILYRALNRRLLKTEHLINTDKTILFISKEEKK